jgi:1-acyl-sn-glycerol-3-phosphate acyltransferase
VDPNDRELPERHEGRLQFQGPSATTGYFRNPEQTRRLFHEDWLDSEDLAYIAGGDIHITGRSKDVIIRGGRNVYPAELEETVGDMPDIRKGNVAVFGSPDPESGTERVVVLAETRQRDAEALARLRTRINEAAVNLIGMPPDAVVLAPPNTVPKTSSGKIRRAASREIYESGDIGRPRRAVRWQVARLALAGMLAELRRVRRVVAAQIFGGYAWALFGLLALIVLLAVTLLPPVSWRWAVIGTAVRSLARATRTPLAVQGMENLPPGNQPCLYVSNHTSYLDGYVMAAVLPRSFSFVAKGELRDKPLIRFLLDRIQVTFVERLDMEKGIADARDMASVARQGRPLMFFPEGTFTRTPGLLAFHMGAFVTAVEAGLPVVPIAIRGTRSILRSDSWLPRRGAIAVTVDAPIDPRDFAAEGDAWTQALRLRDAVRTRILHHCGEPDLAGERPPIWAPPTGDS